MNRECHVKQSPFTWQHTASLAVKKRKCSKQIFPSNITAHDGFINSGWKDTVLVMPNEEIDVIKPIDDYTGLFLYHCHTLEHEDLGMMRNFM